MKVLLTGGNGFLGHAVQEVLQEQEIDYYTFGRGQYDLLSYEHTRTAFKDSKADHVIHLAAVQGGIKFNNEKPVDLIHQNSQIALNVFKAANEFKVKKLVYPVSICAYPKGAEVIEPNTLNDGPPDDSVAPHAYSKRLQYYLANAYRKQYGLNAVGIGIPNMFGPHANFHPEYSKVTEAVISKLINAKQLKKRSVDFWGSGSPKRQFTYVKDAAAGIVEVFKNYNDANIINIGPEEEVSIKELVQTVAKIVGYYGEINWTGELEGRMRNMFEVEDANILLDLEYTPFEIAMRETIQWYKNDRVYK